MRSLRCLLATCVLALTALLAGPLPAQNEGGMQAARVRHARSERSMQGVVWDAKTGRCAAGALQLMSKDELNAMRSAWNTAPSGVQCEAARKKASPRLAPYPVDRHGSRANGAARLVVQVDERGDVAQARALCATDERFAEAAVAYVRTMTFQPMACGDTAVRSTMLLPLSYSR